MIFNSHLSTATKRDVYIDNNGNIFVLHRGQTHAVGNVNTCSTYDVIDAVEEACL